MYSSDSCSPHPVCGTLQKRDIKKEIEHANKDLEVKAAMKKAMEDLKSHCGLPYGEDCVRFLSLYGDMCLETDRLYKFIEKLEAEKKD